MGKNRKIIAGITIVAVVVGGISFFATANMRDYSKAEKQYKHGNYKEAMKIYSSLGHL